MVNDSLHLSSPSITCLENPASELKKPVLGTSDYKSGGGLREVFADFKRLLMSDSTVQLSAITTLDGSM